MSASAHLPPYYLDKIGLANNLMHFAKQRLDNKRYLDAYEFYSQALGYFDSEDVERYPAVSNVVNQIQPHLLRIGNMSIKEARLVLSELRSCDSDPFCTCRHGSAQDHFCDFCSERVTVVQVYNWNVEREKEKLERERKLAVLVKLKSAEAPVLQAKVEKMRKELELLEEALKCTREEAMDAQEQLELSRGW